MSGRLVILTEIISPYRIPVFNALARQEGIDLHVIFLAETDPTMRDWRVYKEEIHFSYEVLRSWRRRLRGHNLLLNWGLGAAMRRARPDWIVCGGYNYLASWECLWWARRHRVPFMLWAESSLRDRRGHRLLIESLKAKFMNSCQGFVVPGKSSFEYVRSYGVAAEDIHSAPNAVDIGFFANHADQVRGQAEVYRQTLGMPSRYFLFVGRLVEEKGVFDLIEAYGSLAPELRARIALIFVGEGAARQELERRAAAISPGSVQFTGFAQREQLAGYYALAEAFVFPTHSDPWGLVVNEAMACGLAVITSDAAGCTADLVEDRWNGRVVSAGDVDQLRSAMNELACNLEMRCRMGQRSRERIQSYSPEACAAGFVSAALSFEARTSD
jgi:glycosyltransferase involved in cell wall biosynthesis